MFKSLFLSILIIFASSNMYAANQKLANYLGSGSYPSLKLELSKNGPEWQSYIINYQGIGDIPSSSNPVKDWSSWNVMDENNSYYGTIVLHSDGTKASMGEYVPGQNGFSLEGIHFTFNDKVKAYQLTVDKIIGGAAGPFPDAPLAKPATYSDGTSIVLSVNGSNIVDSKGKIVVLKGVVRPSLEWNPQGEHLSEQDIKNIRAWKANTLRIDMNQNYWFASGPASEKGSYKQIINALVHYAQQNKMAIIFDLHWTENGHQNEMANKESIKFWQQVASDYKNFGTVIFELFNEPFGIDKNTWLNGNDKYVGHQQLYDAVRSTGANNICIVNGLDYGYDLSFVNDSFKLKGNNIVYGSHPYNEKGADGYNGPGGSLRANLQGVLGKYPLIFTEFGVNENAYFPTRYKEVYQRNINFANQYKMSYTGFAWWVDPNPDKANIFPDIIKDWNGTPLNGGVMMQDDMRSTVGIGE